MPKLTGEATCGRASCWCSGLNGYGLFSSIYDLNKMSAYFSLLVKLDLIISI